MTIQMTTYQSAIHRDIRWHTFCTMNAGILMGMAAMMGSAHPNWWSLPLAAGSLMLFAAGFRTRRRLLSVIRTIDSLRRQILGFDQ